LIIALREEDRRKIYIQSELGSEVLKLEIDRLKELYENGIKGGERDE